MGATRLTSTWPIFQSCSDLQVEMYQAWNCFSEHLLSQRGRLDYMDGCQEDRAAVIPGAVASDARVKNRDSCVESWRGPPCSMMLLCAGGPSITWTAANTTEPQSFAVQVASDARGLNNTVPLSQLCEQDVQVTGDNSNTVLYTQPQDTCV